MEIEFAVNLDPNAEPRPSFDLLQIRPMGIRQQNMAVEINDEDVAAAFCYSSMALGNGRSQEICDIVFVNSHTFDPARTIDIAAEIGRINRRLVQLQRKYLLIGRGRWGSADRWLGIPAKWHDISGVGAIIETTLENFKGDPSQGSHFFHNITSLGISYLTNSQNDSDFIDGKWLLAIPRAEKTTYFYHVQLDSPLMIKVDGKNSHAVIIP